MGSSTQDMLCYQHAEDGLVASAGSYVDYGLQSVLLISSQLLYVPRVPISPHDRLLRGG